MGVHTGCLCISDWRLTHSVQEIENLDTLKSLEELWLGKNKITEMKVCLISKFVLQLHSK